MPEEHSNDPKWSFENKPHNTEFSVHFPASDDESRIVRFLKKINHLFSGTTPVSKTDKALIGRIYQIQKDAEKVSEQLLILREELKNDGAFHLPALMTYVLDPLIKEINRFQKLNEQGVAVAQQVRKSKDCKEWMETVKKWIELCSRRHTQKEIICQAVIEHSVKEFHLRIDRDLQVIQDYLNHSMDSLDVNALVKVELKDQLEQELSQHIFELYLLKDHPPNLSLDDLSQWRADADLVRETHFGSALHTIDVAIGEVEDPKRIADSGDPEMNELEARVLTLEMNVLELTEELQNNETSELSSPEKAWLNHVDQCEREANRLNSDLRLNHEHVDRVEQVLNGLLAIREQLNQ